MKKIIIMHNMAKSGGTIFAKCLGAMQDVVLLSEIHPDGAKLARQVLGEQNAVQYSPAAQGKSWHGLMENTDLTKDIVFPDNDGFLKVIEQLAEETEKRGARLVLRDWSHIDILGIPFRRPNNRPSLVDLLQPHFDIQSFVLIRHPLKQWFSMSGRPVYQTINLQTYLESYAHFLNMYEQHKWVKYEQFVESPETVLSDLCSSLEVNYDGEWKQRWPENSHVTGDRNATRSSGNELVEKPFPKLKRAMIADLKSTKTYKQLIEQTGYPSYLNSKKRRGR